MHWSTNGQYTCLKNPQLVLYCIIAFLQYSHEPVVAISGGRLQRLKGSRMSGPQPSCKDDCNEDSVAAGLATASPRTCE